MKTSEEVVMGWTVVVKNSWTVLVLFFLHSGLSANDISGSLFELLEDTKASEAQVSGSIQTVRSSEKKAKSFLGSKISDPEVRACAERGLPEVSMSQVQEVAVVGKSGFVRSSTREVFWKRFQNKRSKAVVRVTEPQQDAGVAVLYLETERVHANWYMYQKEFKRPRRVTGSGISGSVLGTDFSYEDFEHIEEIIYTGDVTRMPDVEVGGHFFYVIERRPDNSSSQYSLVKGYIDQALCLPMQTEFYDHASQLKKALLVSRSSVKKVGNRWIPYELTMHDYSRDTHTVFTNRDVNIDPELHDSMFSPQYLKRGR